MADCSKCVHNRICDTIDQIFKDNDGNCCLSYLPVVFCKKCEYYYKDVGWCCYNEDSVTDIDYCSKGKLKSSDSCKHCIDEVCIDADCEAVDDFCVKMDNQDCSHYDKGM